MFTLTSSGISSPDLHSLSSTSSQPKAYFPFPHCAFALTLLLNQSPDLAWMRPDLALPLYTATLKLGSSAKG
eukprot:6212126-Pleurochrysis_carterae.AAC.1